MRTLFTLVGTAAFTALTAQTITTADAPAVGYTFQWQSSGWYEELSTGSGQTWDMSAATPAGGAETFSYIEPSLAPGNDFFPDADVALQSTGALNNATFYDVQPDGVYDLGTYDSGGPVTVLYTDVKNTMRYPCALGTTWTDDAAFETTVDGNPISAATSTSTYTADGSGTLILPNGTYTNVLRLTHTSSETAESFGSTFVITKEEVIFRRPGTREVLASTIHHTYFTNGGLTDELFQSYYLISVTTNITENAATAFTMFPNPAKDVVNVTMNRTDNAQLTVTDALGRVVFAISPTSAASFTLDVRNWSAGLYQIQLLDGKGTTHVQRLLVD
jgi:hypothetical protein